MSFAKLLLGGASRFSGTPPEAPETLTAFDILAAPDGGWCWFQDARAIYIPSMGKVVFGYNNNDGQIRVRALDDVARTVSAPATLATTELDDHDNPALLRRQSDGKLIAMWTTHVGIVLKSVAASADAIDLPASSDVTAEFGGRAGSAGFTYAHLFQLTGEAGTPKPIYFSVRYHSFGGLPFIGLARSLDDGVNWERIDGTANDKSLLAEITYHKAVQNGDARIDFVASNHPDDTGSPYGDHGIYHFYYEGGSLFKTDGTLIGVVGAGSSPGGSYPRTALTQVDDASQGICWIWDIAIDPDTGDPVIVYVVYEPTYPGGRWHYEYARWTGAAWEHFEVADAGGPFASEGALDHGGQYAGGIVLDQTDPTICYFSSDDGTDHHEVYRAIIADDDSASLTPITSGSTEDQIRPIPVYDSASVKVLWNNGSYANYLGNFSLGTRGAFA